MANIDNYYWIWVKVFGGKAHSLFFYVFDSFHNIKKNVSDYIKSLVNILLTPLCHSNLFIKGGKCLYNSDVNTTEEIFKANFLNSEV